MIQEKGATRKIQIEIPPELLKRDLERYCQIAVDEGATEAKVIPAGWVNVDERARLKCLIPRCPLYGQCANCPPFSPDLELLRRAFSKYDRAILLKKEVIPVDDFADQNNLKQGAHLKHYKKITGIVSKIETMAFADGYYFALGLTAGGCKAVFCHNAPCQVIDSGRCKAALKARLSMEAAGIDVFSLATRVGWEIYPIYASVDPKLVLMAMTIGLIFIC